MISTVKNRSGLVYGYIEWLVLDPAGQMKNDGEYIYIKNMWVHPSARGLSPFYQLLQKIKDHPYSQAAAFVYWETARDGYGFKILEEDERPCKTKKMSKIFQKEYISDKLLKGDRNVPKFVSV
jgi:hypothetical protein